jgi:hypothetical protein
MNWGIQLVHHGLNWRNNFYWYTYCNNLRRLNLNVSARKLSQSTAEDI